LIKFDAQCANLHARRGRAPNASGLLGDGEADFGITYHLAGPTWATLQPLI
jgi:hypothetical protein